MPSDRREKLPEEQRAQYDHVQRELEPFLAEELFHQGISRLDQILGGIPDTPEYRLLRGAFFGRRAELLLELDDDEGAWKTAQKAMNLGWYDASVYSIAGWAMYNMEDLELARQQFDNALALDPDRTASLIGRSLVLLEMDEYDLARTDLTHAIHQDPEDAAALAMRAEVHIHLGTLESARRDIEKARKLDPEDVDYGLLDARLRTVDGELEGALEALESVIDEEDASLEALLLRSHLRLMTGNSSGARSDAMRASNAYSEEAFAFVQLAHVQLAEGNTSLAEKAAERAVKLDPSLPDAYLARGAVLRMKGEHEKATEDFERASSEPVELPMLLLGACYDAIDAHGFNRSMLDMLSAQREEELEEPRGQEAAAEAGNPFAGLGGLGGLGGLKGLGGLGGLGGGGGLDPARMLDQIFDEEGNIRGPFKPILKMAMKNAPGLLKNMPPHMLKNMGGIDPEVLENVDFENMSEEELEQQMKLFYKMVKSGKVPMDAPPDNEDGD